MADIPGDTGEGLDIRHLVSGADVVGVFPSGTFNVTAGSEQWIKGGSIGNYEAIPTNALKNNPYYTFEYLISGTATGVTGSTIGSIVQFIGVGSYVQVLSYLKDDITNVGSWS